jgi:hypothetical protein
MDLNEFERLWPNRHELNDTLREELEVMAKSKECRDFVENGDWIRGLCRDLPEENAPSDFAYKMRIYAANNPESVNSNPKSNRFDGFFGLKNISPVLKWSSVTAGIATGALMVMLIVGPVGVSTTNQDMQQGSFAEEPVPAQEDASSTLADVSSDSLATDDSSNVSRDDSPTPSWELQQVSTGQ